MFQGKRRSYSKNTRMKTEKVLKQTDGYLGILNIKPHLIPKRTKANFPEKLRKPVNYIIPKLGNHIPLQL